MSTKKTILDLKRDNQQLIEKVKLMAAEDNIASLSQRTHHRNNDDAQGYTSDLNAI